MSAEVTEFENVFLNLSKASGRVRFVASGLGWKPAKGDPWTLEASEIRIAQWSRAARGYECKIITNKKGIVQLDGFEQDDFETLQRTLKLLFNINLEQREHSVKGWNWGKTKFGKNEMMFTVQNRPAFEIPFSNVTNSNLAGKSEVVLEFDLQGDHPKQETNGTTSLGAVKDELVEMRFYVPGQVVKDEDASENSSNDDDHAEQEDAASAFYQTLRDKAEIGEVAGESIVSFSDILFLTPRGRYDVDMYPSSLRLRGKTYDYKIQYTSVVKIFLLPKPDETHNMIVIGLDPPLRQGQTRYPFIILQFLKEEEIEVELNLEDAEFDEKYADKLKRKYDNSAHEVVTQIFRGLTGRKVTTPGSFQSHHGQAAVKCSMKANEGWLYCLEKSFIFIPKPTIYIPISHVRSVTLSRVGASVSASRTFDLTFALAEGGEHQFMNINRYLYSYITELTNLQ